MDDTRMDSARWLTGRGQPWRRLESLVLIGCLVGFLSGCLGSDCDWMNISIAGTADADGLVIGRLTRADGRVQLLTGEYVVVAGDELGGSSGICFGEPHVEVPGFIAEAWIDVDGDDVYALCASDPSSCQPDPGEQQVRREFTLPARGGIDVVLDL